MQSKPLAQRKRNVEIVVRSPLHEREVKKKEERRNKRDEREREER